MRVCDDCDLCWGNLPAISWCAGYIGLSRLSLYIKLFVTVTAGNFELDFLLVFVGVVGRYLFSFFQWMKEEGGDERIQQRVYAHQYAVKVVSLVFVFLGVCWPGVSPCRPSFLEFFSPLFCVQYLTFYELRYLYTDGGLERCWCCIAAECFIRCTRGLFPAYGCR